VRTIDDILPGVHDATNEGKLVWYSDDMPDSFSTKIGFYRLQIWNWYDSDDNTSGYTAQLSQGGKILDAAKASQYGSKYGILEAVYEGARRSFHKVDEVIDDIETELAKLMK
jgi:hypothetical protein